MLRFEAQPSSQPSSRRRQKAATLQQTKAQLVASRRPDGVKNQRRPNEQRRSLVGSRRPDGVKSPSEVTFSKPQLPSWGFANLLAKTHAQLLHLSDRPTGGAPAGKLGPTSFASIRLHHRALRRRRDDGWLLAAPQNIPNSSLSSFRHRIKVVYLARRILRFKA